MNAPFVVAQADTVGQAQTAVPIRTVKLEKPAGEQAIVIKMDGSIKLDFTAIEREKITLVRAGERLVILFDNKSTITIDPFFDSSGKPLQLAGIELSNNQLMTGEEFAALFPITDDQSVLPAAGEQGPQNTGGQFAGPNVDALNGFNPLDLLPPEQLGNWVSEIDTRPLLDEVATAAIDGTPTADDSFPSGNSLGDIIDDEGQVNGILGAIGATGDVPNAPTFVSGQLNFSYGPDGPGDIVFDESSFTVTAEDGSNPALQARVFAGGVWETVNVQIEVSPDGHTLTGFYLDGNQVPQTVFTLVITVPLTGAFTYTANAALVHPLQDDGTGSTEYEDDLFLSVNFIVTDGNGTPATGTLRITVDDDTPDIEASLEEVCVPVIYTAIKAGHVDERGLDGAGDRDVLLSGIGQTGNDINTTGNDIGVGNQWIDGANLPPPNFQPGELLRVDFVNSLTFTPNPNPDFTYNGHYTVDAASFTIAQIQGAPSNTATVFVQVFDANDDKDYTNDGAPLAITAADISVQGAGTYTLTEIYEGGVIVGVAIEGLNDGDKVTVDTVDEFDRLVIRNFNNETAAIDDQGTPHTFTGGSDFSIDGIESLVCGPLVISVAHDESGGFNPQSGPNPENDVAPNTAPAALTAAIVGLTTLGFAKSADTVVNLFNPAAYGADGPADNDPLVYQISTSTPGGTFNGVNSGLTTTAGSHPILLYSDPADPALVWGVADGDLATGDKVFALYLDSSGYLWVAQFMAIAHDADGNTAAEYDDIASVQGGLLYVTAIATDGDGDQAYVVSDTGLVVDFQDDGPDVSVAGDASVNEGASVNGTWALAEGTDGVTEVEVTIGVVTKTLSLADSSNTVTFTAADGAFGTLIVQADLTWTYTADNVSGNQSFDFSIKATDGDGDFDEDDHTINITDVAGGRSAVSLLNTAPFYEDDSSTTAGQRTNDGTDDVLTISFSLQVFPSDPNDNVDSASIGGIPTGASGTWTDGVNTLTFGPGTTTITPTSGGTGTNAAHAAFLAALESGTTIAVTLAEHDSADVTLTLSAVIDGTATGQGSATAAVDTVAADPTLDDPANQSLAEGGASTTFTLTINANFSDLGDNEIAQVLLGDLPAGWSITGVTGNSASLVGGTGSTALPAGLIDAYSVGYTAYDVTPDANGDVTLTVTVTAPGSVDADATEILGIVARAYDVPTESGTEATLANNVAVAEQSVALTVTDSSTPPTINALDDIKYWTNSESTFVTNINRISFQSANPDLTTQYKAVLSVDVHILAVISTTLSGFTGISSTINNTGTIMGVDVTGSRSGTLILEGTLAEIDALIASNRIIFDAFVGDNDDFPIPDRTLTVELRDLSDNVLLTKTIDLVHEPIPGHNSDSAVNINALLWNTNEVTYEGKSGNDTIVTTWSHRPDSSITTYKGGGGNDTVTVVFSPEQLEEILTNSTYRSQLDNLLNGSSTQADLSSSLWHAKVDEFEDANLALLAGHSSYAVYSPANSSTGIPDVDSSPDAGADLVIGNSGVNVIDGLDGNDIILGLSNSDTLNGGAGDDLLLGGSGNDSLDGGTGKNILSGGTGSDTFKLTATDVLSNAALADIIVDYSFVEGDALDLTGLLNDIYGAGNDGTFANVQLVQSGSDIKVQVETGSSGSGTWADAAVLAGYATSGADPVQIMIDASQQTYTA